MESTFCIETERLLITPFVLSDAPFILSLLNTPAWLEFIGDRKVYDLSQAEAYLENGPLNLYKANGFGPFKVSLKLTGMVVGMSGLFKRDSLKDVDCGYAFLPEFWGHGYAYEATVAVLSFAKSLSLPRIVAITNPVNVRSIHLLEKLGFIFQQQTILGAADCNPVNLYSLDLL